MYGRGRICSRYSKSKCRPTFGLIADLFTICEFVVPEYAPLLTIRQPAAIDHLVPSVLADREVPFELLLTSFGAVTLTSFGSSPTSWFNHCWTGRESVSSR